MPSTIDSAVTATLSHQKFCHPVRSAIGPAMIGAIISEPIYTTQYSAFHVPRSWRKKISAMTAGWRISEGPAPIPFRLQLLVKGLGDL